MIPVNRHQSLLHLDSGTKYMDLYMYMYYIVELAR